MAYKQTMGNNHLSSLAAKGRYGDTEIAKTSKGELWHVNPQEKSMMDTYGMKGEKMVDAIGSGTKNPQTGLEEKFLGLGLAAWTLIAAGTSAAVSSVGSYSGGRASELQSESERNQADIGLEQIQKSIAALESSTTKGRAAVMTDYGTAVETESYKTGVDKSDLFQGTAKALQQSGMATAGTVNQQSSLAWNRIRDRWGMKGDSLLADLGTRMGKIEGKYEREMAKLQSEKLRFRATKKSAEDREGDWYLGKNVAKAFNYLNENS